MFIIWLGYGIEVGGFSLGKILVLVVEDTILRNGVKVAIEMGFRKLYFESDSVIII